MRHRCPGKIESYAKFLEEEKFSLQRAISKFVSEHVIPLDLVFNLEQTPLSYVPLSKQIFDLKVSITVPIKGVDDKREITATFTATDQVLFHLLKSPMMIKPSVVNSNTIPLIALMLHSLQIIGPILKIVAACLRKIFLPILKRRKKNLVVQRNNTL